MESRKVRARVVFAWLALLSFSPALGKKHTAPFLTTPSRTSPAPQGSTTSISSTEAPPRTDRSTTTSALQTSSTSFTSHRTPETHDSVLKGTTWQSSEVEDKIGGLQDVTSGAPEASMKSCPMNLFGFVVAAGDVEACRIELVELEGCDPRQAEMILVSKESGHQNENTQSYKVLEEGVVEVYLKEDLPGFYRLFCVDAHTSSIVASINVGFPVLDVEDWGCLFYNWEELECTWARPYNPAQSPREDYLPWLCVSGQCKFCECVHGTCLESSCLKNCCGWNGTAYQSTAQNAGMSLKFIAKNALTEGYKEFTHTFDPLAIVVPAKMSNVSVAGVPGRREAVVWWKLAAPMGTFAEAAAGVVVQVDHRLAQGVDSPLCVCVCVCACVRACVRVCVPNKPALLQGASLPCHNHACKTGQHTISLEFWWCRFEVRVRVRSAAAPENRWWSDWEPSYVITPLSAPDAPPAVGPGTFQVAARGFPGLCDVTLTWQQVPPLLHNGPDFGYLVQVCGASRGGEGEGECEGEGEAVLAQVAVRESFVVFRNLSTAAPYTLRVAARNSEGHSGTWGAVSVPPDRPALPLLPVVVQHDRAGQDTLYELRWHPGDAPSHTVYVCTGEHEGTNPCTDHLAWTTVANASAANLTLRDFGLLGAAEQVTFALSREDQAGTSSGLAWDRCVTPQPFNTARDPPRLGNEAFAGSSWVKLSWSLDCRSWAGVVEATEAAYCRGAHRYPSNCTEEAESVRWARWKETISVAGLEGGQRYTVWLRLQYRSGMSQWSEGVTVTITSSRHVVWWVVATVVGVLVIFTLLRCLHRSMTAAKKDLTRYLRMPDGLSAAKPDARDRTIGSGGGEEGAAAAAAAGGREEKYTTRGTILSHALGLEGNTASLTPSIRSLSSLDRCPSPSPFLTHTSSMATQNTQTLAPDSASTADYRELEHSSLVEPSCAYTLLQDVLTSREGLASDGECLFTATSVTALSGTQPEGHCDSYVTLADSLASLSVPCEAKMQDLAREAKGEQWEGTQQTTGYCRVDDGVTPTLHLVT
ncbi:uncharacterized protein LOC123513575 [Portunus trituberculatus]|uniref:uncharacterized protein LOC123513575 n=1 Tax=Portunus trituberculatus TaxID=210409 RepID=UPI001E1CD27E|nr:uncharacterized protein LOC123513575 [Portunus trituberculatus]